MLDALNYINNNKHSFCKKIMDNITEYIYRQKRYKTNFSLVLIYNKEKTVISPNEFKKKLRLSDKLIPINENLACVVFDSTAETSYVKAAENLTTILKNLDYKNNFFLSTVYSEDFDLNSLEIINNLFDRLKYAIEHKLHDTVIDQDYLI